MKPLYDKIVFAVLRECRDAGNADQYFRENARHYWLFTYNNFFVDPSSAPQFAVERFKNGVLKWRLAWRLPSSLGQGHKVLGLYASYSAVLFLAVSRGAWVVVHYTVLCAGRKWFRRLKRFGFVYWVWDCFDDADEGYRAIEDHSIRQSERVFFVSRPMEEFFKKSIPPVEGDTERRLLPLGANLTSVVSAPVTGRIGFLGNMRVDQGLDSLLAAVTMDSSLSLDVIGDGLELPRIKERVKSMGLGARIRFFGRVDDEASLAAIVATWQAGVAPYAGSSFTHYSDPGKIKKYLGYGLPIVTTRVTPMVEEIEASHAGEVVAPDASHELLSALQRVCAHREMYLSGVKKLQERYEFHSLYDGAFGFMSELPPEVSEEERKSALLEQIGLKGRSAVDRFFRDNVLLSVAAAGAAAANFLLHPILARQLTVEEYGEIQAMFALVMMVSVIPIALAGVASRVVGGADVRDIRGFAERLRQTAALRAVAVLVVALVGVIVILAAGPIVRILRFDSVRPVVGTAMLSLVAIPLLFRGVLLGAFKRYYEHAVTQFVQAASRVTLATLALLGGLRTFGVIAAVAVAQGVAHAYAKRKSPAGAVLPFFGGLRIISKLSRKIHSVAADAVVTTSFIFFTVSDVVMVRFFFDASVSGEYAGVAIVGRIALFAAGLSGGILSPSGRPGDPNLHGPAALWRALRNSGLMTGAVIVGFSVYARELVTLIVGESYVNSAELLPALGWLMLAAILANDLLAYLITRNRRQVVLAALLGVATVIALSLYDHSDTAAVVRAYTAGALITALASCVSLVKRAP